MQGTAFLNTNSSAAKPPDNADNLRSQAGKMSGVHELHNVHLGDDSVQVLVSQGGAVFHLKNVSTGKKCLQVVGGGLSADILTQIFNHKSSHAQYTPPGTPSSPSTPTLSGDSNATLADGQAEQEEQNEHAGQNEDTKAAQPSILGVDNTALDRGDVQWLVVSRGGDCP